jgi:hypothetical protein
VAVHHLAVAAGQHRDLEAELSNAAAHAIDGCVVLARVPGVQDQFVDLPNLDLEGRGRGHAPYIAIPDFSGQQSSLHAYPKLIFEYCEDSE